MQTHHNFILNDKVDSFRIGYQLTFRFHNADDEFAARNWYFKWRMCSSFFMEKLSHAEVTTAITFFLRSCINPLHAFIAKPLPALPGALKWNRWEWFEEWGWEGNGERRNVIRGRKEDRRLMHWILWRIETDTYWRDWVGSIWRVDKINESIKKLVKDVSFFCIEVRNGGMFFNKKIFMSMSGCHSVGTGAKSQREVGSLTLENAAMMMSEIQSLTIRRGYNKVSEWFLSKSPILLEWLHMFVMNLLRWSLQVCRGLLGSQLAQLCEIHTRVTHNTVYTCLRELAPIQHHFLGDLALWTFLWNQYTVHCLV